MADYGKKNGKYDPKKPGGGFGNQGKTQYGTQGRDQGGNGRPSQAPDRTAPAPSHVSGDFINPYTFVPLSEKEPDRREQEYGSLSGVIDCTLYVQSPTFIPNTTKVFADEQVREHNHKVFCSYTDLTAENKLTDKLRNPTAPVIPGSELRGMVRSIYEQLTNSCFSQIDEFNLPYKRTPEPKKMCLMKWIGNDNNGHWVIYKDNSKQNKLDSFEYRTGAIFILNDTKQMYLMPQWMDIDLDPKDGAWVDAEKKGFKKTFGQVMDKLEFFTKKVDIAENGDITVSDTGKYYVHMTPLMIGTTQKMGKIPRGIPTANKEIFYTGEVFKNAVAYAVPDDAVKRFEYVLGCDANVKGGYTDIVVNNGQGKEIGKKIYDIYDTIKKRYQNYEPLIVYMDEPSYKDLGTQTKHVMYLSPACMTKEFFSNKIIDILNTRENGFHQPCNTSCLCPACRLFGMIGKGETKKEQHISKGKLRFSDSFDPAGCAFGPEQTLAILGNPRISSTEFYLKVPGKNDLTFGVDPKDQRGKWNGTWNYDYYTTYDDRFSPPAYLRHPYTPVLAGRKVYWNQDLVRGQRIISSARPGPMNVSVTPLVKGGFKFRVYFDRLTEDELSKLLFCLRLHDGEAGAEKTFHKIGMGKPLGMGQVSVGVTGVTLHGYRMTESGTIEETETSYTVPGADPVCDETKLILRYSMDLKPEEKASFCYPPGTSSADKVFEWFRENRGSVSAPNIKYTLPNLTDKPKLPVFEKKK